MVKSVLSFLNNKGMTVNIEDIELENVLRVYELSVFLDKREVLHHEEKVDLTFTEFEILKLLMQNPGKVYRKEDIYNLIWGEPYFGDYNIIMRHIHNIRKKIEDDSYNPFYIQTVWGVGYRFNANLSESVKLFL